MADISPADELGRFSVKIEDLRRVLHPGRIEDGIFITTDVSHEPEDVRAAAKEAWTAKTVRAFEAELRAAIAPLPYIPPDRVTARQFKLQLLAEGLLDHVEAWVASQGKAIQLAYDNSGTFARDEPMMQAGFRALGFPPEQIDAFFSAASKR